MQPAASRQPGPDGRGAVVTPEAVALELPLASVGSRAVGALLDLLLQGAAMLVVGIAGQLVGGAVGAPGWVGAVVLLLAVALVRFGYPIGFEARWRGRTPGMAAMGLRVVTREGGPINVRHATVRAAVGIVDFEFTLGLAALLSALSTRTGQRLGDLAAGTVVLHERRGHGRAEAVAFAPPPGGERIVAELDVSMVDPATYARVRGLLLRRDELAADARVGLAAALASEVSARVRPQPPTGVDPLTWLACVAAAYQRRHRTWRTAADVAVAVGSGWEAARRPPTSGRSAPPSTTAPSEAGTGLAPPS